MDKPVDDKQCEMLLMATVPIVKRHTEASKREGRFFNVFRTLDRTYDEVKGHSAFLAELLDPRGSHGQGGVFLRSFLSLLGTETGVAGVLPEDAIEMEWTVTTERWLFPRDDDSGDGGRVDILLKARKAKGHGEYAIVIENKIKHGDEWRQLQRYKKQCMNRGWQTVLCYLTPEGRCPTDDSLGDIAKNEIVCLGYGVFVTSWLDDCIQKAALLPRVRETLVQYQDLALALAGGTLDKEMTMEISRLLCEPEKYNAAVKIEEALKDFRAEQQLQFWMHLKEGLSASFRSEMRAEPEFEGRLEFSRGKVDDYYASRRRSKDFGIVLYLPWRKQPKGVRPCLVVMVDDHIYYGVACAENGNWIEAPDCQELREAASKAMEKKFHDTSLWFLAGWRYTEPKLDFREFSAECLRLGKEDARQAIIADIVRCLMGVVSHFHGLAE